MLVTFRSDAWNNVTLFGDIAGALLKMAGHSGTVPGALRAGDIPPVLARLKQAVADAAAKEKNQKCTQAKTECTDTPPHVGIALRAYPLIQLLAAAAKEDCDVLWEQGAPLV